MAILALAKAAGISKRITPHILRHCNSMHNQKLVATDYEVMELLGWQSTKVHTIDTHAEWKNIVAATTRLGASIGDEELSAQSRGADPSENSET